MSEATKIKYAAIATDPFTLAPCTGDGVLIFKGMRFWDGNGMPGTVTFVDKGGWDFALSVHGAYDSAPHEIRLRWWNLYSTPEAAKEWREQEKA